MSSTGAVIAILSGRILSTAMICNRARRSGSDWSKGSDAGLGPSGRRASTRFGCVWWRGRFALRWPGSLGHEICHGYVRLGEGGIICRTGMSARGRCRSRVAARAGF